MKHHCLAQNVHERKVNMGNTNLADFGPAGDYISRQNSWTQIVNLILMTTQTLKKERFLVVPWNSLGQTAYACFLLGQ